MSTNEQRIAAAILDAPDAATGTGTPNGTHPPPVVDRVTLEPHEREEIDEKMNTANLANAALNASLQMVLARAGLRGRAVHTIARGELLLVPQQPTPQPTP